MAEARDVDDGRRSRGLGGPFGGVSALERVVFFSDAVFAIAITLLAIDVRLPDLPAGLSDASLLEALRLVAPSAFAFVVSFVVIAAFWIGHLRTFRVILRTDGRLIGLNLAFLFFIAALPFPTSVLAQEGDLVVAAILYALFGLVTGAMSTAVWVYPVRVGLVAPTVTAETARHVTYRAMVVPVVFAASIPVAVLVGPLAAEAMWILMVPAQAIVSRRFRIQGALDASLISD
jgi:uncharacterized membrane protein